jgi:hypothetical protein
MAGRMIAGRGDAAPWTEAFRRAGDPPVLMIMGALSSGGWRGRGTSCIPTTGR